MKKEEIKNLEALKHAKQIQLLDQAQQIELKGGMGFSEWW